MPVKAILFDLGETLLNYEPVDPDAAFAAGAALAHRYLQHLDTQALPPLERYTRQQRRAVKLAYLWAYLSGKDFNAMDLLARTHSRMGLTYRKEDLRELNNLFYRPLGEIARLESGALEMLAGFRAKGIALAIVSNTFVPSHTLDAHLEREGLLEFFPVRLYSSEVVYRKPRREIFELAAKRVNALPSQCIFVGDRLDTDVRGANRVGMISVLKRDEPTTGRIKPDHHVRRLADELPAIVESYR